MKVYAVIGGIDYEGENFKSLRLFDCFSTATDYMKHLEEVEGFDYAILETREVSSLTNNETRNSLHSC
jgi:hypothetical protein